MAERLDGLPWPAVPRNAVLLVPVGSTEQHGPHLPFTTDTEIAAAVTAGLAARLPGPVVVAPPFAYGASGEHAAFPGTLSLGLDALEHAVVELVRSADWAARTVLVNGHGGNVPALRAAVALLREEGRDAAWVPCGAPGGDAHAGRTETSVMLHLAPGRVRADEIRPGDARPLRELLPELRRAGVRAVAPEGVLGDPTGATAEEGARLLAAMVDAAADVLADLHR